MKDTNKDGKCPQIIKAWLYKKEGSLQETKEVYLCIKKEWPLLFSITIFITALFIVVICLRFGTNGADFVKIIGGGLLALWGLYFSFRRTNEMQRENDMTQENLKSIEDRNRAQKSREALNNAIAHLSHKSEGIRIVGIQELHNIAKDHEKQRDIVQKILCTHVRKRSNDDDYVEKYRKKDKQDYQAAENLGTFLDMLYSNEGYQVAEEIQTILNILCSGEKDDKGRAIFKSSRVDFKGAQLQGAILQGAILQGANLQRANLQGAKLLLTNLQEANLQGTDLQGAHLQSTDLQWANLREAKLRAKDLQYPDLEGAIVNYGKDKDLPEWCKNLEAIKSINEDGVVTWEPKWGIITEYLEKYPEYRKGTKARETLELTGDNVEIIWLTEKKPKAV